ncbi:MAG: hypothetical protein RBR01_04995 [Desulfobacterales bacterium]|jgi:hypothetical protein|nr:hypothetical protein [Desulfobacterales bacterium]MDD3082190.1 hypothetical protein [Desulfobacterales bacterium]MDD3951347.1 hypothetical protein [Desulfobacterales bacterium]MDD4462754.1 hypothetical protein [Desulfobacterales bacterium]MDY0377773.1 hypothetical protein [Desulfobacterales bacterium]
MHAHVPSLAGADSACYQASPISSTVFSSIMKMSSLLHGLSRAPGIPTQTGIFSSLRSNRPAWYSVNDKNKNSFSSGQFKNKDGCLSIAKHFCGKLFIDMQLWFPYSFAPKKEILIKHTLEQPEEVFPDERSESRNPR